MSFFYCACIRVALCVIGLMGNWLSVYVFSRRSMRCSSINVLLTGLSATDFLLLLIVVPIFALPPLASTSYSYPCWCCSSINVLLTGLSATNFLLLLIVVPIFALSPLASQTGSSSGLDDFTHYMIAYVYPLAVILQLCLETASVWIFMLITVERFLAVCVPLRVGQYCTVGRSRAALGAVYAAALAYNLVRFWEYTTEPCDGDFCGSVITVPLLRHSPAYWLWYGTVAYLLTQFLIPFLLIAILNGCVIYKMYQARRQRALLSSSEKSEHRTAMMMIIVVVVFAACYSLSFVLNFHEAIDPDLFYRPSTSAMAYLLNDISNTLVVLNSACTFLVYLGFSRRYRFIARWTLLRCLPTSLLKRWLSDDDFAVATRKTLFMHSVVPRTGHFDHSSNAHRLRGNSTAARTSLTPSANGRPPHRRRQTDCTTSSEAHLAPLLEVASPPLRTASDESLLSPQSSHRLNPAPLALPHTLSRSTDDLLLPALPRTARVASEPPKASPEHSLSLFTPHSSDYSPASLRPSPPALHRHHPPVTIREDTM